MKPTASTPRSGRPPIALTPYQKFVVAVLAFLQFTIVLDFMVLSPLGAILLPELGLTTKQFGMVLSVYAFAAGAAGILCAGFADRYDRKRLLLVFYTGFVLGTVLCGVAPTYLVLLIARIVTGLFAGVVGAVSLAIVADLFPLGARGRVMGAIQSAFGASQALGIPVGLWLANTFGWHAPFLLIAGVAAIVGVVLLFKLRPVDAHLKHGHRHHPLLHLWKTASSSRYQVGFAATMLLATGGFMLMPFASAFSVNNLHISLEQLPTVYAVTGVASMILGPVIGRLSDRFGKYPTFCVASAVAVVLVVYYTHLDAISLSGLIALNIVLFASIFGRMSAAGALTSAVPAPQDRGAYMAISGSLQQLSGGIAAFIAGMLVRQSASGRMEHYPRLGWAVAATTLLTVFLMYRVYRLVQATPADSTWAAAPAPTTDPAG